MSIGRLGPTLALAKAWIGKIDEVRVWNAVRTPTEIAANYRVQFSVVPASLVGYWRFNDGTGPTAADAATPPHAADLRGTARFSPQTPFGP